MTEPLTAPAFEIIKQTSDTDVCFVLEAYAKQDEANYRSLSDIKDELDRFLNQIFGRMHRINGANNRLSLTITIRATDNFSTAMEREGDKQ